jgi:threonine dehydrogenase-like Zn-dependent dehydrogenase
MMKVVELTERRRCELRSKPLPRIRGSYVLLKIHVAPMCNEHHAYAAFDFRDRNRPDSLGHEAAGEVVEAGPGSRFRPGDRVVALSGYPCGRCDICGSGAYAHCPTPVNPLDECNSESGECCFAQYMIKADRLLLPIPDDMSYEHAAMACCGLGATFTALENMRVGSTDTLLVTGLGPVGLGAIINAVMRGTRVIAAGRSPARTELARRLGALAVIDPRDPDAVAQLRALTGGRGVDCAVECSAAPMYQRLALDAVARRGRVTFLGESGELPFHVDRDLIQKGVTLMGSLDLYLEHATPMMRLIARASSLIDAFITHRLPLSRIAEGWELQLRGECGKIVLYPWE